MAKKTFELGATLAEVLGKVSDPDTLEQIQYIPLQDLISDERNFYSMDGVEELAANIELIGLQQPLRVQPGEPPYYVIVSGHRRAAALRIQGGPGTVEDRAVHRRGRRRQPGTGRTAPDHGKR